MRCVTRHQGGCTCKSVLLDRAQVIFNPRTRSVRKYSVSESVSDRIYKPMAKKKKAAKKAKKHVKKAKKHVKKAKKSKKRR